MKKYISALLFLLIFVSVFSSCGKKNETNETDIKEYYKIATVTDSEKTVSQSEPQKEEYISPIDFSKLLSDNPDTIGWLEIKETDISLPILMNPSDNKKYLTTAFDGTKDRNGALFCEHNHNAPDFSDPVTIIYGHRIDKGKMFYNLQEDFTDRFDELPLIDVYTENEHLSYSVFAAVPFDNRHILYWFDFTDEFSYDCFFDEIKGIKSIGAHILYDEIPKFSDGEKVLILSTCLKGNIEKRYLVLAKQIFDI